MINLERIYKEALLRNAPSVYKGDVLLIVERMYSGVSLVLYERGSQAVNFYHIALYPTEEYIGAQFLYNRIYEDDSREGDAEVCRLPAHEDSLRYLDKLAERLPLLSPKSSEEDIVAFALELFRAGRKAILKGLKGDKDASKKREETIDGIFGSMGNALNRMLSPEVRERETKRQITLRQSHLF